MGIETHPVQTNTSAKNGRAPAVVTAAAYEVYCELYGAQQALAEGGRGGFGAGELIAFLYARGFPRNEWRKRADEAFKGMENI